MERKVKMSLVVKLHFCLLVVIIILFNISIGLSQDQSKDSIKIEKGFWGDNYFIAGQEHS